MSNIPQSLIAIDLVVAVALSCIITVGFSRSLAAAEPARGGMFWTSSAAADGMIVRRLEDQTMLIRLPPKGVRNETAL